MVDTLARVVQLKDLVRDIPDFPKPGIVFKDIMPLLRHKSAFNDVVGMMAESITQYGEIDHIIGIESRGFIFGAALAQSLRVGFIPARKPGKLPGWVVKQEYDLEYGKDTLEIQGDALLSDDRVVVVDDVLATGGTAEAANRLVKRVGGEVVASCFLIELTALGGRQKLTNVHSLIQY